MERLAPVSLEGMVDPFGVLLSPIQNIGNMLRSCGITADRLLQVQITPDDRAVLRFSKRSLTVDAKHTMAVDEHEKANAKLVSICRCHDFQFFESIGDGTPIVFTRVVRSLLELTDCHGVAIRDLFLLHGSSQRPSQSVMRSVAHPQIIWELGKVGVGSIRYDLHTDHLYGLALDERGGSIGIVYMSGDRARSQPQGLHRIQSWFHLATVRNQGIVTLSRPKAVNGVTHLLATMEGQQVRVLGIERNGPTIRLVRDQKFTAPYVVIGQPCGIDRVSVAYRALENGIELSVKSARESSNPKLLAYLE